jgi:hypothetical protein
MTRFVTWLTLGAALVALVPDAVAAGGCGDNRRRHPRIAARRKAAKVAAAAKAAEQAGKPAVAAPESRGAKFYSPDDVQQPHVAPPPRVVDRRR